MSLGASYFKEIQVIFTVSSVVGNLVSSMERKVLSNPGKKLNEKKKPEFSQIQIISIGNCFDL